MEREVGYVYMITSPTNRIYVGSTSDYIKRFSSYRTLSCKKQIKLYNSICKYGYKNHIIEIIWKGDIKDMLKYEFMIGTYYEVLENGLNCSLPKHDDCYSHVSSETRVRMSESASKRVLSEDTRNKISNSNKGRLLTELQKIKYEKQHCKKVVCLESGIEFSSIKDAAKYYNLNKNTLAQRLRGVLKNNTSLRLK